MLYFLLQFSVMFVFCLGFMVLIEYMFDKFSMKPDSEITFDLAIVFIWSACIAVYEIVDLDSWVLQYLFLAFCIVVASFGEYLLKEYRKRV